MNSEALNGLVVLVAEDEYMIATELASELVSAGAVVLGPVASLDGALDLIEDADHIDAAILDVNLRGEKVFPAAEMLEKQGVPFFFATGYDQAIIPQRFSSIPRIEKPIGANDLKRLVSSIATR